MRLGLIGSTGHWHTYAPALEQVAGLTLAAVAPAGPEETVGAVRPRPRPDGRYASPRRRPEDAGDRAAGRGAGLRPQRPDPGSGHASPWSDGLPVMTEKPMAMDLPTLEGLFRTAQKTGAALVPMHTMRGVAELAAVRQAVRAGEIGDPVLSFSQKTYKWGKTRPDFYRSRKTFPGLAPWVGIHAFDWLHWILGDVFTEVMGREGTTAQAGFPGLRQSGRFRADDAQRRRGLGHARLPAPGGRAHARGRTPADRRCSRGHRDRADRTQGHAGDRRQTAPHAPHRNGRSTSSRSSRARCAANRRPRSRCTKPAASRRSPSRRSRPPIPGRLSHSAILPMAADERRDDDDPGGPSRPRRVRVGGIQDVAYGLTSMVGCRRWNRDESFHVDGVELSIMGHDRPGWRFRISALMLLVIIVALALTPVNDHDDHDRRSPRPRERIGPMPGG